MSLCHWRSSQDTVCWGALVQDQEGFWDGEAASHPISWWLTDILEQDFARDQGKESRRGEGGTEKVEAAGLSRALPDLRRILLLDADPWHAFSPDLRGLVWGGLVRFSAFLSDFIFPQHTGSLRKAKLALHFSMCSRCLRGSRCWRWDLRGSCFRKNSSTCLEVVSQSSATGSKTTSSRKGSSQFRCAGFAKMFFEDAKHFVWCP